MLARSWSDVPLGTGQFVPPALLPPSIDMAVTRRPSPIVVAGLIGRMLGLSAESGGPPGVPGILFRRLVGVSISIGWSCARITKGCAVPRPIVVCTAAAAIGLIAGCVIMAEVFGSAFISGAFQKRRTRGKGRRRRGGGTRNQRPRSVGNRGARRFRRCLRSRGAAQAPCRGVEGPRP